MEPHWNNARNTQADDDDDYCKCFSEQRWTNYCDGTETQRPTSGCHPSAFFHRANAFPSTTTSSSAKSRRLVWFVVSKSHFYKQRTRSGIADVNTNGGRPTLSQWWLVLIYDHQRGYFKDWNKTDFRLTSLHVNRFVSFEVAAILRTAVKTASRVVGETT